MGAQDRDTRLAWALWLLEQLGEHDNVKRIQRGHLPRAPKPKEAHAPH